MKAKAMEFKKARIEDIPALKSALSDYRGKVCDISAGNIVFWRDRYDTEYHCSDDGFAIRFGNMSNSVCYWCGTNRILIDKILEREGGVARFSCLTADELSFFRENYSCEDVRHARNWDDYIYNSSDIALLAGKKYCGQRNHINKFNKLYNNFTFETIDKSNADKVKSFCYEYFHTLGRESGAVGEYEERYLYEQLDNIEKYGQLTLALLLDGQVIGFSIGEIVLLFSILRVMMCWR